MPPRKRSETSLRTMMGQYAYFCHKWRDKGFLKCPHCHRPVIKCPSCHRKMLLPKAKRPDFLVAMTWAYIECKQGEETWSIDDFSDVQQEVLTENDRISASWVFLELGGGVAPNGRGAWLIPWSFLQCYQITAKIRSVRFEAQERSRAPLAKDVFSGFELEWKRVWERGRWTIPPEHAWWKVYGTDVPYNNYKPPSVDIDPNQNLLEDLPFGFNPEERDEET